MRIFIALILLISLNSCKKQEDTSEITSQSTQYEHIKKLAWMVGEWTDEDGDEKNVSVTKWDKHRNFLYQKFSVSEGGKEEMEGLQVIGWDPTIGKIRSWIFDSDGGFGTGTWSEKGKSFVVETSHVLADGRHSSSINIYTPVNADSYTWESVGREVGGELLPNLEPVTVVRKK